MGRDIVAKADAILSGVTASAKVNHVELFSYVRDLLIQLSVNSPPTVATMLLDAWLAAHPESRRSWSR